MRGKQRTHSLAFLCTPLCLFELAEVVTRIKTPGEGPSLQDTMGSDCSGSDGCDRKRPSSSETKSGPRHNSRDTSPLTILPRRCFQTLPHSPLSINRVPLSFPAQPSVCVLKRGLNSRVLSNSFLPSTAITSKAQRSKSTPQGLQDSVWTAWTPPPVWPSAVETRSLPQQVRQATS